MRPVELGESLVPGTGLTLIRKTVKRSFVLLRVVSYEDVPKKEKSMVWFKILFLRSEGQARSRIYDYCKQSSASGR